MISEQAVSYRDNKILLSGVFALDPDESGPRPGILVVHGGAGLDAHARNRARQIAAWGYIAFACDMYGDGIAGNRERVMATIAQLRAEPSRLRRRAEAGRGILAAHPQCDGRIAAVGYCFGGMTVLELARVGADLVGAASIHGTLSTGSPTVAGSLKPKILVCHGALDPHVPILQVNAFIEEMKSAKADWQMEIYGGALHGFTHEGPSTIPGVAYDAQADLRSTLTLRNFLAEVFAE